ncbi:MAG: prolipoprotein diacylglyceryl transferase [Bacteroidales bacterium]
MILDFVTWNVNPDIFTIPNVPWIHQIVIRWYSLLFGAGFVIGYFIILKIFKKEGIKVNVLDKLTTYMFLSTIVGARLGHVFFYQPEYYFHHPWEILKTWEGGLASHGAAFGILFGLYLFSRSEKRNYMWILDRIVIVIALAGMFIRLGNLMNSEIYGDVTNLPWGFIFVRDVGVNGPAHHPTQLYEAICYLISFVVLYQYYWQKKGNLVKGNLFAMFLILIFGTRFIIEFVKEPQVGFEQNLLLNMGQILSIPFIIIGIVILIVNRKKTPTPSWISSKK